MRRAEPVASRSLRCPHCGRPAGWAGNPHRPFCSLTCRLIDLGVWLEERYRIPGPGVAGAAAADDVEPAEGPPARAVGP